MNSPTNAFRRLILKPAPNVVPQPKLANLAMGFKGTLNNIAMLVLSLLSSPNSPSSACPSAQLEQETTTSRMLTVAIQIDFMRLLQHGQLRFLNAADRKNHSREGPRVFRVAPAPERYPRSGRAAGNTVNNCS